VEAAGEAHDGGGSVGFADVAGGFVAGGVPGVADLLGCGGEGDAGEIAFGGSYHAPAPVLGNYGNPVAGEVYGGGFFRWEYPLRSSASWWLGVCGEGEEQNAGDKITSGTGSDFHFLPATVL
jgi:hypothetical protein